MSNKKESTATATATETGTEKKEKAPAGSSIQAQCKQLILAIALETKEHLEKLNEGITKAADRFTITDFVSADTAKWLDEISEQLASTQQRGLPPEVRLANVNQEINDHYLSMPVSNGKAAPTPEWEAKQQSLFTKRTNIERAIKAAKEQKDKSTTSTTA